MRVKAAATIGLVTVLGTFLITAGAVYADDTTSAMADAEGNMATAIISPGTSSYVAVTVNADGSIINADLGLGPGCNTYALAFAATDAESQAVATIHVQGDAEGEGMLYAVSDASASDGASAATDVRCHIDDRTPGDAEAVLTQTFTSVASGWQAVAYILGGDGVGIDNSSSGSVDINATALSNGDTARAYAQVDNAGLSQGASGDVNVEMYSSAVGDGSYSFTYVGNAVMMGPSSGSVDVSASASATGQNANAQTVYINGSLIGASGEVSVNATATASGDSALAFIIDAGGGMVQSTGSIDFDMTALAEGDASQAIIAEAFASIQNAEDASIDSNLCAHAVDGGLAQVSADTGMLDGGSYNYVIYALAYAQGEDSVAISDVGITNAPPDGGYIAVDADGSGSFAIVFMLSAGNDVWAVSYSYSMGGQVVMADAYASEQGVILTADVRAQIFN